MTNEDILTKIEVILPKLQQWIFKKEASFEPEEMKLVKEIAAAILPGKVINYGCTPCAGELLKTIWSYYQRESTTL